MLDRLFPRLTALFALFLMALLGGCASTPAHPADGIDAPPLELQGPDSVVAIDFGSHPAISLPHDLQHNDICYLTLGDAVILCSLDGSFLLFGRDDGVELVKDSPLARLSPVGHDQPAADAMHMLGAVFLIAGTVDRLPDALSDYLGDPGPHRRVAMAAARLLTSHDKVDLPASARGGTFKVTIHLTAAGRQKLTEALQEVDGTSGLYLVNQIQRR